MDVVTFLRARLDEDEAPVETIAHVYYCPVQTEGADLSECYGAEAGCAPFTAQPGERMLRDIAAKRAIVDNAWLHMGATTAEEWLLPLLAFAYAGHPDYDPEWSGVLT